MELLELAEKWLEPFGVTDPFSKFRLEGYLSLKPDYRYGALALLKVGGQEVPQLILGYSEIALPLWPERRISLSICETNRYGKALNRISKDADEKSLYPDFEVWGCVNLTMILEVFFVSRRGSDAKVKEEIG